MGLVKYIKNEPVRLVEAQVVEQSPHIVKYKRSDMGPHECGL